MVSRLVYYLLYGRRLIREFGRRFIVQTLNNDYLSLFRFSESSENRSLIAEFGSGPGVIDCRYLSTIIIFMIL